MTKDEYEDFALRYKGCGACFPMYHTLSRFEKMWFSATQKDVAELEKENAELKGLVNQYKASECGSISLVNRNMIMFDQLTKATEIIKKLYAVYYDPCVTESDLKYRDELFAEIKQFISEVEK